MGDRSNKEGDTGCYFLGRLHQKGVSLFIIKFIVGNSGPGGDLFSASYLIGTPVCPSNAKE
jgi:hypothetical protein